MKLRRLIVMLAVASMGSSLAAADYYLAYHAKGGKSAGYYASGVNYVKANGKGSCYLLVKMTENAAGDFSGLGDAVYLVTDTKAKVALEEPTNVQFHQKFDSKGRALLFGSAYNIDKPQAAPNAGVGGIPATAVTGENMTPYGASEYFQGVKAKLTDIGLVVGGAASKKLVNRHLRGQDNGFRANSPVGDNFAVSATPSYKLDLDRTRLINAAGPGGAPPATLEAALAELERSLPGGGWTTL